METKAQDNRNYGAISPSAYSLLLLKGLTTIPFARQAAGLITLPEKYIPDYSHKEPGFWLRVLHFESRYQSIGQLLTDIPAHNILELSSGFSFRGLHTVREHTTHYIDTDLAPIIEKKKEMVSALQGNQFKAKGKLELLPLNALDEQQFSATVNHFGGGPVTIVNEGLLMYLGMEEKERLCAIIRNTLKERGGYWITADAYIKRPHNQELIKYDDKLQQFFELHHVRDNMFGSMEAAEAFFKKCGFTIDKEAAPDYAKLSTLPYLLQNISQQQLQGMGKAGKIQATWRLKVAD